MAADFTCALWLGFDAQRHLLSELPDENCATSPEVLVADARIDRVAAPAECRPRPDVLLRPNRHQCGHAPRAHFVTPGGKGQAWKDCNLEAALFIVVEAI